MRPHRFLLSAALLLLCPTAPAETRFRAQVIDPALGIGYGLAAADVDGDGRTDLVLADKDRVVWYGAPAWTPHVIAEKLTARDHVCLAARDIDGDGRAEIAVGAEWNPSDTENSGAVFVLAAPADRTARWTPVRLHHEPTVHRMRWVRLADHSFRLVVVPLHGRGNRNGQGAGVRVLAYRPPADPAQAWETTVMIDSLHLTHNLDVVAAPAGSAESVVVCAREGVVRLDAQGDRWSATWLARHGADLPGAGEVRFLPGSDGRHRLATIEPMHGNSVCLYEPPESGEGVWTRRVLDDTLVDGHALAWIDVGGAGKASLAAGWRAMNKPAAPVGIRLYAPHTAAATPAALDDNTMACEDLVAADLDGDGDTDLAASGRRTRNLVIYWNESPAGR